MKVWETVQEGNDAEAEIDVSNLPAGMYFLRLQFGENTITRKVIVQH